MVFSMFFSIMFLKKKLAFQLPWAGKELLIDVCKFQLHLRKKKLVINNFSFYERKMEEEGSTTRVIISC